LDMFLFRTRGEEDYAQNLATITDEQIESWRGRSLIDPAALKFVKPQLHVNFRFIKKGLSHYWNYEVRSERRLRSSHGWFLPWHISHQMGFKHTTTKRVFPSVTEAWSDFEVPRNCPVEMPPVFTYKPSHLVDPSSGWWVVAFTEHAAKTAAFILFEAYDNFKLWWLSSRLIEGIRRLPLAEILGNQANANELRRLLDVIESTDFAELPPSWRLRTRRNDGKEFSPGRRGRGGDWVYYDPWKRRKVDKAEAEDLAFLRPRLPEGHPTGLDFQSDIPEYTFDSITAGSRDVYSDDSEYDMADDEWSNAVGPTQPVSAPRVSSNPIDLSGAPRHPSYGLPGSSNAPTNVAPGNHMGSSVQPPVATSTLPVQMPQVPSVPITVPSHPSFQAPFNPFPPHVPAGLLPYHVQPSPYAPPMVMPQQFTPSTGMSFNAPTVPQVPSAAQQTEVVRTFLRQAGVPESQLGGTYSDLMAIMRGLTGPR
ncbi:MAG: hypothetical protein AAGC62_07800, partial [Pseudomonadota bacterium]